MITISFCAFSQSTERYMNEQNQNSNPPNGIAIISSDLLRAKQTAQYVADAILQESNQNDINL